MAILNESLPRSARISVTNITWDGTSTTSGDDLKWTDTRMGEPVPDWESRIRHLESASSNYTRTKVEIATFGRLSATIRWRGTPTANDIAEERVISTYHNKVPVYSAEDLSRVDNVALGNFLKSANEAASPFKGMVFLGELKETLKMLKRPASALRDGFSTYLKRARREQRRYGRRLAAKGMAGMWLENALGWQPLLGSIEQAVNAYSAYQAAVETYRAFGKCKLNLGGSTGSAVSGFLAPNYFYTRRTEQALYKGEVRYVGVTKNAFNGIQVDPARRVAELSGFRLAEFVPTVWELIPHSFVVDYFSNIGDILNGMHALANTWVYYTRAQELQASYRCHESIDEPKIKAYLGAKFVSLSQSSTPAEWIRKDYIRSVPLLHLPGLVLELPPLGFKWGTLAALLTARVNA